MQPMVQLNGSCQKLESENILLKYSAYFYIETMWKVYFLFLPSLGNLRPQNVAAQGTGRIPNFNLLISLFKPLRQQQYLFYKNHLKFPPAIYVALRCWFYLHISRKDPVSATKVPKVGKPTSSIPPPSFWSLINVSNFSALNIPPICKITITFYNYNYNYYL